MSTRHNGFTGHLTRDLSSLATNFWVASKSSKIVTNAILELSKRAEVRGTKIVFKLMVRNLSYIPIPRLRYTSTTEEVLSKQSITISLYLPKNGQRKKCSYLHRKISLGFRWKSSISIGRLLEASSSFFTTEKCF